MESSVGASSGALSRTPVPSGKVPRRAWAFVHAAWLAFALSALAEQTPRVAVHLEIRDELTGSDLDVSIRRQVAAGTEADDFMDEVVEVEYRRYPGVGVFVTGLCGVAAPKGTFWALSIDGKRAEKGISELRIERPVRIRWELSRVETADRNPTDQIERDQ